MSPDQIKDLLSRTAAGDRSALGELIAFYLPAIRFVIGKKLDRHRRLRPVWDVDDFVQVVLGKFWRGVDDGTIDIKDPMKLPGYLLQMARNAVEDEARRAKARRRGGNHASVPWSHEAEEQLINHGPDAGQRLEWEEQLARVRHLLTDEDWRLVVSWARRQSWKEIAGDWGRRVDPLKKKLARILKELRAKLARGEDQ